MKRGGLSRFLQSGVFMALVRVSPWGASFYFLWIVTRLYFLANREDREVIRSNLSEVFGGSCAEGEIDVLLGLTLRGIFNHYFEKLFVACSTHRQWREYFLDRIGLSGRGQLDGCLARDRGVILVTAHFGAVEFLPGFLTLLGYRVAIIAKFKTQRLRDRCRQKAQRVGATIIDAGERSSFFLALSALSQGRVLITQCDEVECWRPYQGRAISLFGTAFQVDRILTTLQRRSASPLVFGFVRREAKGRYTVQIEPICGSDGALSQGLAETILKRLEKLVYTYPTQWYIWKNFHLMKATGPEDVAGEDRAGRNLPITPPPIATDHPSYRLPQLHGQCCPQASL